MKRRYTRALNGLTGIMIGTVFTVSSFCYVDVGASDVISLQSPNSSITALSVNDFISVSEVSPDTTDFVDETEEVVIPSEPIKLDEIRMEANTYQVSADDLSDEEEILDVSAFTYDGTNRWINADLINVRFEPSIDADIVCQLNYADVVLQISYGNKWSYIRLEDGTEGFVFSSLLTDEEPIIIEEEIDEEVVVSTSDETVTIPSPTPVPAQTNNNAPEYTISDYQATLYASCALNVRSGPGIDYSLVRVLNAGDQISIIGSTSNGWYQLSDGNFVKADLCSAEPPQNYTPPSSESTDNGGSSYSDFASYCLQYVGTPYVYAGSSPSGFDCSGFVDYVYANYYGISLPHNAAEISVLGTSVTADSVQVGDVLCHDYNGDGYVEHVSIYIGNGTCIHASNSRSGVITSAWPMGAVVSIRRFI